ncbi:pyridoxamine 5'-phosphate oxidase family protein [Patescibacteria group bacterium]|nr:pyridoxamine 5'-phosphate oxidase family protein [Patescibacteria group bacterium]MBU1472708.1 pyridoxamine 5'-phosphate oxidase family protein [Patescibacteria group bacterium]MBU2459975.1 pyridoxamine 5'-phosphate oxidase family protein [Patescibacteria group bacterium]MBU2544367.1 pyridoxamine 5'-phosphate oxidase family protein [Patescibacteria group bacterium]
MTTDKQELLTFLKSENLMALATIDKKPWICNVYFVTDDNFNLYFISKPATTHCQNIAKNNSVTCSVANSSQKVTDQKVGAQIRGTAQRLNNLAKVRWMLAFWNKMNPGFETIINLKNIQNKVIKSRAYQVKPEVIKFFNEKLYGPEGQKIFRFS